MCETSALGAGFFSLASTWPARPTTVLMLADIGIAAYSGV